MNPNMDMAEQAQKPQETSTQAYRICRKRKLPSDIIKFIQQTSLETYYVFGIVLGARNSGVTMPGQSSALIELKF